MESNDYYINAIKYALDNAVSRFEWYQATNDSSRLQEATDWVSVANIYIKSLNT